MKIQFKWNYESKNYFEEPITLHFNSGKIVIKEGVVIATIPPKIFHEKESLSEELNKKIKNQFNAVMLTTYKTFKLIEAGRTDIREDGKTNKFHYT